MTAFGSVLDGSVIQPENRATVAGGTAALVRRRAIERALIGDQASRGVSAGGAELSGAEFIDHGLGPIDARARQLENSATSIKKTTPLLAATGAPRAFPSIFRRAIERAILAECDASSGVLAVRVVVGKTMEC